MASLLSSLSLSMIGLSILLFLVSYIVISCILNYRKLRQFKGPPLAAFSRVWLFWQEINCRLHTAQHDAIKKYGSPCRIGPNLLVTNDVELIRHMNAPGSRWRRGEWYTGMRMDVRLDTVFSTRDEQHHAELKAKESGGVSFAIHGRDSADVLKYNGRDIDTLEPDINARIADLCDLIKRSYNGVPMNFGDVARFFTLDVLSTVAFGRPFGYLAANEDLWSYGKESENFLLILALVLNHRFFRRIYLSSWFQALAGPKPTDKTGMGSLVGFARKAVSERFGPDRKVKKDMLGHFVEKGLSALQCEVEAMLQILAGDHSTTTVLRCTLLSLIANPSAYARLRAEVDEAAKSAMISSPVKYSEAQKLPYLVACLWEGLRMHPPLFGLRGKYPPAGGENVNGVFYPEGIEMGICDEAMCRREDVFGPDSHIYRPDRWMEADEETRKRYTRIVDSIFGTGRMQCLGKHIAMMELHKTFVELIRNFDWQIADPFKGVDMLAHGIWVHKNIILVARPRD